MGVLALKVWRTDILTSRGAAFRKVLLSCSSWSEEVREMTRTLCRLPMNFLVGFGLLLLWIRPAVSAPPDVTYGGFPIYEYSADVLLTNFAIEGICVDQRGFVYASDEFGLLEYNSARWRRVFDGSVLDLETGPGGTVYGLRQDEIGRWSPSDSGGLEYESFKEQIEGIEELSDLKFTAAAFKDLARVGDDLYATKTFAVVRFATDDDGKVQLTGWNRRKRLVDPARKFRRVREVDGRPLFQLEDYKQLSKISYAWLGEDDQLVDMPPLTTADGEPFLGHVTDFVALGDGTKRFIATTSTAGVYLCDNGKCTVFDFPGVFESRPNYLAIVRLGPGRFAVSTTRSGILFFDADGNADTLIPPSRRNERTLKMRTDSLGRLWTSGRGGLLRINHASGVRRWNTPNGRSAFATVEFDGRLLLGTSEGVYAAKISPTNGTPVEPFSLVEGIPRERTNNLDVIDGYLFVSQFGHLVMCDGIGDDSEARLIRRESNGEAMLPYGDDRLLAITRGSKAFEFPRGDELWKRIADGPLEPVSSFTLPSRVREPFVDGKGSLWASGQRDYVEPIVVRYDLQDLGSREYRGVSGVPFLLRDQLHLASSDNDSVQILKYSSERDEFVRADALSEAIERHEWLRKPKNVRSVATTDEEVILIASDTVGVFRISDTDSSPKVSLLFGDHDAGRANEVRIGQSGTIWAATEEYLLAHTQVDLASSTTPDIRVAFSSFTSRSPQRPSATHDARESSIAVRGAATARNLQLDFEERTLEIEYSVPFATVPENVRYQTRLLPVDTTWSDWGKQSSALYSGLAEGKYRFEVRARTFTNEISEASSVDFVIHPPWQRSPPFYAAVTLAGLGVIAGAFAWRRRLHAAHVRELEKEIVERRRAEEELRRSQTQLLKRERIEALGEMAAGVAHDVNNALTPILVFSELLNIREDLPAEFKGYVESIYKGTQEASGIIQRIQPLYRGTDVSRKPTDIAKIVEDVVAATKLYIESDNENQKRIEFHTQLESVLVHCVDSEIRELLNNIVQNSTDAIEYQGRLEVSCKAEGDQAIIAITDNGCGMSAEDVENCSELFFTTKGGRGSGIGLSASQAIVRLYKGKLKIESQLGVGTTVKIQLQVADAPKKQAASFPDESPVPRRVLVVDDVDLTRNAIVVLLESLGSEVRSVRSSVEALGVLANETYDLVLTDYLMPGMNGYQLCKEIRRTNQGIRLIIASGHQEPGMNEVCDCFLPKPISMASLREALLQLQSQPLGSSKLT